MKTPSALKRTITALSLLSYFLSASTSAARSDSTSEQVARVRSMLSSKLSEETRDMTASVLVGLNAGVRENSVPSSYFFKSLLEGPTQKVYFAQQFGPLPVIDSSMSEQEVALQKKKIEDRSCLEGFGRQQKSSFSEIESVLAYVKERLVPESKRKQQIARKLEKNEIRISSTLDFVLSEILTAEQRKMFGSVHDYEQNGPAIRALRLTHSPSKTESSDMIPYSKRTVLSLSMLTSVRTGQDKAFIGAQSCLLDLWTAQEWEFGKRLGDLLSRDRSARKQPSERYKALLLGRKFSTEKEESDFLKNHLSSIGAVRPFMEERLAGALQANRLLSQLSTEQLDKLIDMFLVLSEPEFKSAGELSILSARARENGANGNLDAELVHAQQSVRDLVALESNATKERSLAEQNALELNALKQMR